MKKLLKGFGVCFMASPMVFAGVAGVSLTHDVNPVVMESRSLGVDTLQEPNNIFDDVEALTLRVNTLEAENLSLWNAIDLNSLAIHNNAVAFGGLNERVTTIEDEMLNVDRYETTCTDDLGFPMDGNMVFKHHYDSSSEIEYWKYESPNMFGFVFGDYSALQNTENFICDWW